MENVCVLMSTYNGEKFLEEQLESILNQKGEFKLEILIRDDGSSDNTISILKKYQSEEKIKFNAGKNLKPARSFVELLKNAPDSDFYAFSDQDDFWMENKIENALKKMKEQENELIVYFSNVKLVDKELNILEHQNKIKKNTLAASFISSPAIGCTMVINRKMREKILEKDFSEREFGMHDSWIYRVGLSIDAAVIYDENSYIKYRQHENNVIGVKKNKNIFNVLTEIVKKRKKYKSYIAKNILDLYGDEVTIKNRRILNNLSKLSNSNKLKDKMNVIADKEFRSYSYKMNFMFIFDILRNNG